MSLNLGICLLAESAQRFSVFFTFVATTKLPHTDDVVSMTYITAIVENSFRPSRYIDAIASSTLSRTRYSATKTAGARLRFWSKFGPTNSP